MIKLDTVDYYRCEDLPQDKDGIVKPENYKKPYFSLRKRLLHCLEILRCKAIAVRFQCDIEEEATDADED